MSSVVTTLETNNINRVRSHTDGGYNIWCFGQRREGRNQEDLNKRKTHMMWALHTGPDGTPVWGEISPTVVGINFTCLNKHKDPTIILGNLFS